MADRSDPLIWTERTRATGESVAEGQKRLEQNAEYQRRKIMSHDERGTIARDNLAKAIHEQNQKSGRNSTFEEAHRKASEIANKHERKRNE